MPQDYMRLGARYARGCQTHPLEHPQHTVTRLAVLAVWGEEGEGEVWRRVEVQPAVLLETTGCLQKKCAS